MVAEIGSLTLPSALIRNRRNKTTWPSNPRISNSRRTFYCYDSPRGALVKGFHPPSANRSRLRVAGNTLQNSFSYITVEGRVRKLTAWKTTRRVTTGRPHKLRLPRPIIPRLTPSNPYIIPEIHFQLLFSDTKSPSVTALRTIVWVHIIIQRSLRLFQLFIPLYT